jgi:aryl-phospho-beta-D-glucosidase BglC (GH1 family)
VPQGGKNGMNTTDFLVVSGSHISNRKGEQVVLRGTGVGGWLNMENFIAGYPSTEEAQREVMLRYTGEENCNLFYKGFLDNFVTEQDIRFIRSLGMNLIRLPINYRHLEDDLNPFNIRADGFFYIDQMVKWCGENDMYVILDLHALPGFQNQAWHSDNPTHKALYWKHRHFRERVVNIWKQIAARYKDCPQVAGYNLVGSAKDS